MTTLSGKRGLKQGGDKMRIRGDTSWLKWEKFTGARSAAT